jgi:dTMP kinase
MYPNPYRGTFIVFEGIDGSGKSTQTKLLVQRLKKEGKKVATFDFPQYGTKSAGMVEEYLSGKYGSLKEVGPYQASIFYAVDRYDASFKIRSILSKEAIIVSDRYIGSNVGHQGSKISSLSARKKFFSWLYDLEYNIFQAPKPTRSFLLKVPPRVAHHLCENKERRKTKKTDIHEESIQHLQNAERSYLHAAKLFPKDFTVIECMDKGKLLSRQTIHEKIWKEVRRLL